MKRIHRNPQKFEVISSYESLERPLDLKRDDALSRAAFMEQVSHSIESGQSNDMLLHGRRIESMFEYVAASFGKPVLIKREDAGEVSSVHTDITPPDFRLVLDDGTEFLVEVKNCHDPDPMARYELKRSYLDSIENYAHLCKKHLFIAIFWSRFKKWALLRPSDLVKDDEFASTSFFDAIPINRMSMLGDINPARSASAMHAFNEENM